MSVQVCFIRDFGLTLLREPKFPPYTLRTVYRLSLVRTVTRELPEQFAMSDSQSVFIDEGIYRINKLTTTDKALYWFYVADQSVPPIYILLGGI